MELGKNDIVLDSFDDVDMGELDLPMIAVYNKPTDYPDQVVARLWDVNRASNLVVTADTVEAIRLLKPSGMAVLPRDKEDKLCVVEVWM